jgi:hypothetical protein
MNQIISLKNWLIENTLYSKNYKTKKIILGTYSRYIEMDHIDGLAHPFDLYLADKRSDVAVSDTLLNLIIDETLVYQVQFIKRISYTPFFYSYITGDKFAATIIDFYQWQPALVSYRVILVQHENQSFKLKFYSSGEARITRTPNRLSIGDWQVTASNNFVTNPSDAGFHLSLTSKENDEVVIVFGLHHNNGDFSIPTVEQATKLLRQLSNLSKEKHISNLFIVQDTESQRHLDDLWMAQNLFTPDAQLDKALLQNPQRYEFELTWAIQVCLYLGWNENLQYILDVLQKISYDKSATWRLVYQLKLLETYFEIPQKRCRYNSVLQDIEDNVADQFRFTIYNDISNTSELEAFSEEQFFYSAFFDSRIDQNHIISNLQQWWNIFSLPLFQNRFKNELSNKPEKLLIIYMLAVRYNLPWCQHLADWCLEFEENSLFQFFIFLQIRLCKRSETGAILDINSGPVWNGNIKRFKSDVSIFAIQYTKFGEKTYSTLQINNKIILRFDHEVGLRYDKQNKKINVYINTFPVAIVNDSDTVVTIRVSDHTLMFAPIWRQGEIYFLGLRIRWIFKKRRFQFTVIDKGKVGSFYVNDRMYKFENSIKEKFYIDLKKRSPMIGLMLLDGSGRSFHFRSKTPKRTFIIGGWCKDHNGLVLQHVNYRYAQKQHIITVNPMGTILEKLILPGHTNHIDFSIKQYHKTLQIPYLEDQFLNRILNFSPVDWAGDLVVLLHPDLGSMLNDIKAGITKLFNFVPRFAVYEDGFKCPVKAIIFYISKVHHKIEIMSDSKFKSAPYLEIGVDSIDKIFDFLTEPLKKLGVEEYNA